MNNEQQTAVVKHPQAETAVAGAELAPGTVSKELICKYLESMGNNLPQAHRERFVEIATAFNLNPFKREIYGIPYGNTFNIIVGYEVYLKRGERSQQLDGWKVWIEGEGPNMVAKILIHRKDKGHPFEWEVELSEYDMGNSMWKKKPKTMLKKVVVTQGFRLFFPDEFDGLPYIEEELGPESGIIDTTATAAVAEPARDAKATKEALDRLEELLKNPAVPEDTHNGYIERLKNGVPTQEAAEQGIAKLTAIIKREESRHQSANAAADEAEALEFATKVKYMHTLGTEVHGENWNTKRAEMVVAILPGQTSSRKLNYQQVMEMIERLQMQKETLQD